MFDDDSTSKNFRTTFSFHPCSKIHTARKSSRKILKQFEFESVRRSFGVKTLRGLSKFAQVENWTKLELGQFQRSKFPKSKCIVWNWLTKTFFITNVNFHNSTFSIPRSALLKSKCAQKSYEFIPRGSTGGIRLCRKWNQYRSWFNWTSGESSTLKTMVWIQLVLPMKWS